VGVLSPRASTARREGVALIALDGKPAKAYKVGAVVEGDKVLQSVGARNATLGPKGGPAVVALSLPALPEAARGTPGGAGAAPLADPPGAEPGIDAPVQNGGAPQRQLGIGPPPPTFVPGMRPGMQQGAIAPPAGAAPTTMPPAMPSQPLQPFNRRVGPGGNAPGASPQS
jgi:general secretion pathway protein C